MSLANKYRPNTFEDVVEQPVVVKVLQNMCKSELQNRNLLLIGSAGTGKTTLARIFGNAINDCECNPIEIDAASNNGVDYIRDIVQEARTFPISMKYKVIIVDEAHALSQQSWQCLLKVLEESPARTVFIFCTTNPEKIPATIISRLQVFRLSKISLDGINSRLKYILDTEYIKYDESAVLMIAKLANGGMRDSLTMLDKVIAYSSEIDSESVQDALNLPDHDIFFNLLASYAKHDNAAIVKILDDVYNSGINFFTWMESFQAFVVNAMKYIYLKDMNKTNIPPHYESKLSKYSDAHAVVCIKLSGLLSQIIREMKSSSYQLEIAISYFCHRK